MVGHGWSWLVESLYQGDGDEGEGEERGCPAVGGPAAQII